MTVAQFFDGAHQLRHQAIHQLHFLLHAVVFVSVGDFLQRNPHQLL